MNMSIYLVIDYHFYFDHIILISTRDNTWNCHTDFGEDLQIRRSVKNARHVSFSSAIDHNQGVSVAFKIGGRKCICYNTSGTIKGDGIVSMDEFCISWQKKYVSNIFGCAMSLQNLAIFLGEIKFTFLGLSS